MPKTRVLIMLNATFRTFRTFEFEYQNSNPSAGNMSLNYVNTFNFLFEMNVHQKPSLLHVFHGLPCLCIVSSDQIASFSSSSSGLFCSVFPLQSCFLVSLPFLFTFFDDHKELKCLTNKKSWVPWTCYLGFPFTGLMKKNVEKARAAGLSVDSKFSRNVHIKIIALTSFSSKRIAP